MNPNLEPWQLVVLIIVYGCINMIVGFDAGRRSRR